MPYATVRVAGEGRRRRQVTQGRQAVADAEGRVRAARAAAREDAGARRAPTTRRASSSTSTSRRSRRTKDLKLVLDETGTICRHRRRRRRQAGPRDPGHRDRRLLRGGAARSLVGVHVSATTDGAGAFTLHGLPDGSYRLRALRSSGGIDRRGSATGTAAKTGDKNVKLTLPAPATLVGKIALEGGDAPKLANVSSAITRRRRPAPTARSSIEDLEPGNYDVRSCGPEFAQMTKRDVKLEPGKTTDLGTITVHARPQLTGRVVDARRHAVAGATRQRRQDAVLVEGARRSDARASQEMTGARIATTDQDGDFTIIGIAKRTPTRCAEHPDKGRSNPIDVAGGQRRSAAGHARAARLRLDHRQGDVEGRAAGRRDDHRHAARAAIAQVVDRADRRRRHVHAAKVAEGTHVLNAMQMKGMSASSTSATVEVTAGQTRTSTIDIPVGTITVAVTVKPLAGAKLDAAQVFLFARRRRRDDRQAAQRHVRLRRHGRA